MDANTTYYKYKIALNLLIIFYIYGTSKKLTRTFIKYILNNIMIILD